MAVTIKNAEEIKKMERAGRIVAETHLLLEKAIKPGITTKELDAIADDFIRSRNAVPSFKGYNDFPASICIALNEQVIHGFPGLKKLKSGDIISIDIGAYIDGFHGDAARTHAVGDISEEDKKLIEVTKKCFFEGILYAKEGYHLHEISAAIQTYVESFGFSVVRDFVGHGIGRDLHEDPQIPNYKQKNRGPKLYQGMTLAIEPMVNQGHHDVEILSDGWTVVTKDGSKSAHYENTVLITDGAPALLTI